MKRLAFILLLASTAFAQSLTFPQAQAAAEAKYGPVVKTAEIRGPGTTSIDRWIFQDLGNGKIQIVARSLGTSWSTVMALAPATLPTTDTVLDPTKIPNPGLVGAVDSWPRVITQPDYSIDCGPHGPFGFGVANMENCIRQDGVDRYNKAVRELCLFNVDNCSVVLAKYRVTIPQ